MKRLLRSETWLSFAALALAATVVIGRETPTLELMERPASRAPVIDIDLAGLDRSTLDLGAPARDPFARRSFAAPPPAVVATVVRAAPKAAPAPEAQPLARQAPELPFRFVGRIADEAQTFLILARGDEIFTTQAGQTLAPGGGDWRVEDIKDHEVVFTYLPLQARRSLPL